MITKTSNFWKKETSRFNSVYLSTHNNNPNEKSIYKNEIIDKKKFWLFEKEIASLKSVKYMIYKDFEYKNKKIMRKVKEDFMENKKNYLTFN